MAGDGRPDPDVPLKAGVTGDHPAMSVSAVAVARTAAGQSGKNTLDVPLRPIACWRMDDPCFEFDRVFVLPAARHALAQFEFKREELRRKYAILKLNPPISIFGHADPIGKEPYNKTLSQDRAEAVYGLLRQDPEIWTRLFTRRHEAEDLRRRLEGVPPQARPERVVGDPMHSAIKAYMKYLCGRLEPLKDPDFLGNGQYAWQGCSEFNPLFIFSKSEWRRLEKPRTDQDRSRRDLMNACNRRVTVFLFEPGTRIGPGEWRCAAATDITACKAYKDWMGARLANADEPKKHPPADTFACRFYDDLASLSPCEGVHAPFVSLEFTPTTFESYLPLRRFMKRIEYADKTGTHVNDRLLMEWVDEDGHVHTTGRDFFPYARLLEQQECESDGKPIVRKGGTVLVRTHLIIRRRVDDSGRARTWYVLRATVVWAARPEAVLFQGQIDSQNLYDVGGTWVRTGGGSGNEVWRLLSAIQAQIALEDGSSRDFKVLIEGRWNTLEHLPRKNVASAPGINEKMDSLHAQLRGRRNNIAARVRDLVSVKEPTTP